MTNYLILVPFLFLICGCSIPTEFYIQNDTEAVQTITITYKKFTLSDLDKKIKFDFVNEIIDPHAFRKISNLCFTRLKFFLNFADIFKEFNK